jgi:predicted aspartyl protease
MLLTAPCGALAADIPLPDVPIVVDPATATATPATVTPESITPLTSELPQLSIDAAEPRYVAPTRRDRIGRIWAPVLINGHGPFRLVLDTGASRSGVNAQVAQALGIPTNRSPPIMLLGVTGRSTVPTILVDNLTVGDLMLHPVTLPIVNDPLGGAEGVLGIEGLTDKRVYIDFDHDLITIRRSHNERAPPGFLTIPILRSKQGLIMVDARVGGIPVLAVLDTGGQSSIGNIAMREALAKHERSQGRLEHVEGVTTDVQVGESYASPPILLGTSLEMRGVRITYGDMHIFEHWNLTHEPVVLIGMDAIGTLETVIIDYHRREVQLRMHNGWFNG